MEKELIQKAINTAKENSKERKFKQSYDLIVNLKDINIKNPEEKLDFYMQLPHQKGKKAKICALVGGELIEQAKETCDTAISTDDFIKYQQDKKLTKKLAEEHDYFIAQATIMPKIAAVFGKVFGPKGKMPNPKAGCVVPPNANLKPLFEKLQDTLRIITKTSPTVQVMVGKQGMDENEIIENIQTVYHQIIHHVPQEKNNIRSIFLKLTMGAPVRIGSDIETKTNQTENKKTSKNKKDKEKQQTTKQNKTENNKDNKNNNKEEKNNATEPEQEKQKGGDEE